MTNNKTHWSYLAGLIDGEGCITIVRSSRSKTNGKTYYQNYTLQVDIFNSSLVLMKWLVQYFGGVYYSRDRGQNWKSANNWRPKGLANRKQLLLGILPYLVIKREQAITALAFLDIQEENPSEREKLYQKMLLLNQKGKSVETDTQESSSELKIQPELIGDDESDSVEILNS
jgi:hypothetical protein